MSLATAPPTPSARATAADADTDHENDLNAGVLLGSIPAMYDPTFGNRVEPKSDTARLLRVLHANSDSLPATWTLRELRTLLFVKALLARSPMSLTKAAQYLTAKACLDVTRVPGQANAFSVKPLPSVDVRPDPTFGGLKRLAAWMAYEHAQAAEGRREGGGVCPPELVAVLQAHGIRGRYTRSNAASAVRDLAAADPFFWCLAVHEVSGRTCLSLRSATGPQQPADVRSARGEAPTDRLLPILRERVAAAVPPMICLSDLTTEQLHQVLPDDPDPRGTARSALSNLVSTGPGLAGKPLVDLGVFRHRRWITLPEHAQVAAGCLQLRRLEATVAVEQQQVRSAVRCPVHAVRRERLDVLRERLDEVEATVRQAERVSASPAVEWIARSASRIRRAVRRIEVAVAAVTTEAAPGAVVELAGSGVRSSLIAWTELADEALHATRCWPTAVGARALAIRVAKHAGRIDGSSGDATAPGRVGSRGYYSIFEVRTLVLGIVGDIDTRRLARRALRSLGPRPSVAALRAGLGEPHVEARLLAATGLGLLGGREAVVDLERAARHDPEPGVREVAMWALSLAAPIWAAALLPDCLPRLDPVGQQRARTWVEERQRRGPVSWAE